jgi:ABC transporter substrate binding protein
MARITQGDCAQPDKSSRSSRAINSHGDRPVRRHPNHGALIRGGVERDRSDRHEWDRARCRSIRTPAERRRNRNGKCIDGSPSRIDHFVADAVPLTSVYPFRYYSANGGLASYGPDPIENYTRAAGFVDRVLKGAMPADLPVQAPTKYELAINLKTAKALSLTVPMS